jgi:hypothetical protein
MTANVMQFNWELIYMLGGAAILAVFAVLVAIQQRPRVLPGSQGHRRTEDEGQNEEIRADGYIDSFARTIEEAGGSMPLIVKIAIPGVLLWWLLYLILFWNG